jgi:hypothetical protein
MHVFESDIVTCPLKNNIIHGYLITILIFRSVWETQSTGQTYTQRNNIHEKKIHR